MMRRILLFDTVIDGHHADYLTHLIRYWVTHRPAGELLVVAQASFEPTFQELVPADSVDPAVRFIPISQADIDQVHGASMIRRSAREWALAQEYIRAYRPTHTLLMYFDIFQPGLLLGEKAPCAVSGIYFRPDFHYPAPARWKARLNVLRKKLTLLGVLRRRFLTNLFCLDHSVVPALRQLDAALTVVPLPDPVRTYTVTPGEVTQLRTQLGIKPGRRVFLLFGSLDERKGIEPLLDALHRVSPAAGASLCVLLVGAIAPDYRERIEQRMATISPNIQVISVFGDVRGRAIQPYFELSDYVLALYQQHVGMASVLIRAVVSNKPVLSSNYGYMGNLVQEEQLGATVDATDPAAIAQSLEQITRDGIPFCAANAKKLAAQNADTAFAETIISRL